MEHTFNCVIFAIRFFSKFCSFITFAKLQANTTPRSSKKERTAPEAANAISRGIIWSCKTKKNQNVYLTLLQSEFYELREIKPTIYSLLPRVLFWQCWYNHSNKFSMRCSEWTRFHQVFLSSFWKCQSRSFHHSWSKMITVLNKYYQTCLITCNTNTKN